MPAHTDSQPLASTAPPRVYCQRCDRRVPIGTVCHVTSLLHVRNLKQEGEQAAWEQRTYRRKAGYLARLSTPGCYLDCTAWSLCDTQAEAEAALRHLYGEEEEEVGP